MPQEILHTAAARFEAARRVDALPANHHQRQLHGHGFQARLHAALPEGWAPFPGGEVAALRQRLQDSVARLDYRLLNDTLADPSDENLARWLHREAGVPGTVRVGIQSTLHEGVVIDSRGHAHLWRRHAFESAHRLPNVPPGHKCGRLHGHGFEAVLHVDLDETGGAERINSEALDRAWAPLQARLHLACLNDIEGLHNPTSELLCSWIWQQLKPELPGLSGVTVHETGSCGASFDGSRYRIWKEMTLDSAVVLRRAPQGHPLSRVHGHTCTLRLHLCAPLDEVLGWTVDFGDVKELFTPLFKALDHHPLHEMAGLPDCDCASLAQWIMEQARPALPALHRVDLDETAGCGAIVSADGQGLALAL